MSEYVTKTNLLSALGRFKENTDDLYATNAEVTDVKNAINQLDHRLENIEQSKGDYIVSSYKDGSVTPSGKGKWCVVEGVEGVSRVENQLLNPSVREGTDVGVTYKAYANGKITLTGTATTSANFIICNASLTAGHKYLLSNYGVKMPISSILVSNIQVYAEGVINLRINESDTTNYAMGYTTGTGTCEVRLRVESGRTYNLEMYPFLTDLTLYFGGTIPSDADTIEEIQTNYPHLLQPSAYGTRIVDTTYSAVKSVGVNLFDETTKFLANGFTFSGGYWSRTALVGVFETDISYEPNTQYAISYNGHCSVSNVNFRFVVEYTDGTSENTTIITSTTDALYTWVSALGKTISSIRTSFGNSGSVYLKYLQIEEGSSATSYSPYMTDTLTLPEPVTLKSAGSVQDTDELNVEVLVDGVKVDKRRQTVRTKKGDLGQCIWTYNSSYSTIETESLTDISIAANWAALTCTKYTVVNSNTPYVDMPDKSCKRHSSSAIFIIKDSDITDSDIVNYKIAKLLGTELAYETATYAVTLSDPILDNTLLTEAGGRLSTVQTGTVVDGIADLGFITL